MYVYVIRHGESETNLGKRLTGWFDTPLTDKGRSDAKKAGLFLKDVVFDKIFASDLVRAKETAEIALPGCQYEISKLVKEINVGSLANTKHSDIPIETKQRTSQIGYQEFGGESRDEFKARILQFMKQLESSNYKNVAVFSHAGWMCAMMDLVVGLYLPRKKIYCGNCAIAVYKFDGDWQLHSLINHID